MIFFELVCFLVAGLSLGSLLYFAMLVGLTHTFGQSDFILPGILAVAFVFIGICINFDFSLTSFLTHSEKAVTGPLSVVESITDKVKYIFLFVGSVMGSRLGYKLSLNN